MAITLQLIIGVLLAIFLFAKILIHAYLDKKSKYDVKSYASFNTNINYLIPYLDKVSDHAKTPKRICNFLWIIFVLLAILLFFLKIIS